MEGRQRISTANKLATTVGEVSFIEKEIVAQFDVERIGSDMNMLVVEIDQQKYKKYLSSESDNLTETRHYHRVPSNTGAMCKKVFTDERGSLETAAIEPLFGQEILAEDDLSIAEEGMRTGLIRPNAEIEIGELGERPSKPALIARLISLNARL